MKVRNPKLVWLSWNQCVHRAWLWPQAPGKSGIPGQFQLPELHSLHSLALGLFHLYSQQGRILVCGHFAAVASPLCPFIRIFVISIPGWQRTFLPPSLHTHFDHIWREREHMYASAVCRGERLALDAFPQSFSETGSLRKLVGLSWLAMSLTDLSVSLWDTKP